MGCQQGRLVACQTLQLARHEGEAWPGMQGIVTKITCECVGLDKPLHSRHTSMQEGTLLPCYWPHLLTRVIFGVVTFLVLARTQGTLLCMARYAILCNRGCVT